jgi:uncharacterized lipoprotein YehR (DUF1307 family)
MSRQPTQVQITIDQKQLDNVEYFKYLGSLIAQYVRCTHETKFKIAWQSSSNKKTFYQNMGLKFKEETSEMLQLDHNFL